jgi:hypothetical protein
MKKVIWSVILLTLTITILFKLPFAVTLQSDQIMRERILSKDFLTAQTALEENKKLKNVQAVCLSLEHPSLVIKRQAAEALQALKDKAAIKCLVSALEKNQVVLLGGSEMKIEQGRLNESIVSAINAITGLSLPAHPQLSQEKVRKIKAKTEQWLSTNK